MSGFQWNLHARVFEPSARLYRAADLIQHWWLYHNWRRRRHEMARILQRRWRLRCRRNAVSTITCFWRQHILIRGVRCHIQRVQQEQKTMRAVFKQWQTVIRKGIRRKKYLGGFWARSRTMEPKTKRLTKESKHALLEQMFHRWKSVRTKRHMIVRHCVQKWRLKRRYMDWKKQRLDRKSAMFMLKFSCDFFRFICRFEDIPSPVPSHSMTYMMNMYLRKLFLVVNGPKPSGSMSWLETVNAIRTDVGNSPLIKLLV